MKKNILTKIKLFSVSMASASILSVVTPTSAVVLAENLEPEVSSIVNSSVVNIPNYLLEPTEANVDQIFSNFGIHDEWGNLINFNFEKFEALFPEEQVNSEEYIKLKSVINNIFNRSNSASILSRSSCIHDAVVGAYGEAVAEEIVAAVLEASTVAEVVAAIGTVLTIGPEITAAAVVVLAGVIVKECFF